MRAREAAHDHEGIAIKEVILVGRPAMVDVGAAVADKTDGAETPG